MARPKRIEYEDVTFYIFKGQTLERFIALLPEWRNDTCWHSFTSSYQVVQNWCSCPGVP